MAIDIETEAPITLREAAAWLKVNYRTVQKWVRFGLGTAKNPGDVVLETVAVGVNRDRTTLKAVARWSRYMKSMRAKAK